MTSSDKASSLLGDAQDRAASTTGDMRDTASAIADEARTTVSSLAGEARAMGQDARELGAGHVVAVAAIRTGPARRCRRTARGQLRADPQSQILLSLAGRGRRRRGRRGVSRYRSEPQGLTSQAVSDRNQTADS